MSNSILLVLLRGALAPSLLVAAAHAAPAPGGAIWLVDDDGGPSVDATSLQQAADSALEGDMLLVMPGVYGSLDIDGKSLVIVSDGTGPVMLDQAQLWIHNLGPGQTVVVRGLEVVGGISGPPELNVPLRLESNQGHVWLEDCTFTNTDATSPGNPVLTAAPGATVTNCAAVTSVRCEFRGSKQVYTTSPFAWTMAGIYSVNSSLIIHDSLLEGADGAGGISCFGTCPGNQAGPGLAHDGGLAFVTNSTLTGGQGLPGGDGTTFLHCGQGGHGGHAVMAIGTDPGSMVLIGTTLVPGTGGMGGTLPEGFTCNDGSDGFPLIDVAGINPVSLPGPAPQANVDATTDGLALANLDVTGQPGDIAFLFISPTPNANPLFGISSVVSIAPPQFHLTTVVLDGAGEATIPLLAPPPPGLPGAESLTLYLQLAHLSADLNVVLGGPTAWTILAAGI